jgi:glycosyltransferase involved in cell wall biosynthesis
LDIVLISNADYETNMPTSKQNIARALVKRPGVRVLYVQPGFDILSALRNRSLFIRKQRNNKNKWAIKWVQDRLAVLIIPFQIPFGNRFLLVNRLNQFFALKYILSGIHLVNFSKPVLWAFDHRCWPILRKIPNKKVIYHRTDNFTELCAGITGSPRIIRMYEEKMVNQADLVIVSAKELSDIPNLSGVNWVYIPHGVDLQRFENIDKQPPREYDMKCDLIICYQGSIDRWVDFDLLFHIAKMQPTWCIYLVGPIRHGFNPDILRSLGSLPNIKFVGRVKYNRIPSFISHSDVCVIPFLINSLTRGVNPLKLWEYLACGKPVVSTPLPEVDLQYPLVRMASTPEKFVEAIKESVLEDLSIHQQRRRIAQTHSWDIVIDQIISLVE